MVAIKVCEPVSVPVSVLAELTDLRAERDRLRRDNEALRRENEALRHDNDRLRQENEDLRGQLEHRLLALHDRPLLIDDHVEPIGDRRAAQADTSHLRDRLRFAADNDETRHDEAHAVRDDQPAPALAVDVLGHRIGRLDATSEQHHRGRLLERRQIRCRHRELRARLGHRT